MSEEKLPRRITVVLKDYHFGTANHIKIVLVGIIAQHEKEILVSSADNHRIIYQIPRENILYFLSEAI